MASGPTYRVPFRRRREGKTNYRKRLRLLLSGKPRMVVRKSNRYIRAQLILAAPEGDKTVADANSAELAKFSWEFSKKNTPAAYLTGLLLGKRALRKGFKHAILDMGLHTPSQGCRIYAALKGAVDAGLEVPHDPSVFPAEERIRGEHIAEHIEIVKRFEEVKKRIEEGGA